MYHIDTFIWMSLALWKSVFSINLYSSHCLESVDGWMDGSLSAGQYFSIHWHSKLGCRVDWLATAICHTNSLLTSPFLVWSTRLSETNKAKPHRVHYLGFQLCIVRCSTLNQLYIWITLSKASKMVQACTNVQSSWVQILSLCSKQTGTKAAWVPSTAKQSMTLYILFSNTFWGFWLWWVIPGVGKHFVFINKSQYCTYNPKVNITKAAGHLYRIKVIRDWFKC